MSSIGSLFCGIGGIDLAFQKAGFKISWANDLDENCEKTYNYNFLHKMLKVDIVNLSIDTLSYVDVITAGFPCQPFSIAGKQEGFNNLKQGNMIFEVLRIINLLKPTAFLLENVPNLLRHDEGKTIESIETEFNKLGYSFKYFLLNAKDFNIPQNRNRVYIVGFK